MVNISDIIASKDKITFFVGSGISFNSGVASVNDIVGNIIEILTVREIKETTHNKENWYEGIGYFKNGTFRLQQQFERFMGFLKESIPVDERDRIFPDLLKKIFASSQNNYHPNANHYAIAQLVKNGRCKHIYTTNFDTLIEQALECLGLAQGRDFEVILENFEDHIKKAGNSDKILVIKIHGCISKPETIITTMNDIIKETNIRSCTYAVKNIFLGDSNNKLVIAGYSFSDEYDVNSTVKQLYNEQCKSIIYLEHNLNGLECISTKFPQEQKYSFLSQFSNTSYCRLDTTRALCEISEYQNRQNINKVYFKYNFLEKILFNNLPEEEKNIKALKISIEIQERLSRIDIIIPLYERLVKLTKSFQGKNSADYAIALIKYADQCSTQCRAERLYKEALKVARNIPTIPLEPFLIKLANLYKDNGLYDKAISLYSQSLKISEANFTNKPYDRQSLSNVKKNKATIFGITNILDEEYKNIFKDNPPYQSSLNSLKRIEESNGNGAKVVFQKAFYQDYIFYAEALSSMAEIYRFKKEYNKAISLYNQILRIYETLDIDESSAVCRCAFFNSKIGELYIQQGEYSSAEQIFKKASDIYEKILGKSHPAYAATLHNLAELYCAQSLYDKAEPLYQEALEIKQNALGKSHPDYATTLHSLARLYYAQGLYEKAEPLYQEALEITQNALGENHPNTQMVRGNLTKLQNIIKNK